MPDAGTAPLAPGSTIGILGGGQLGRMLAVAAAELGFRCHVYCPDADSPAFAVAARSTVAAYDDQLALRDFLQSVDVATFEFENVPVAPLAALAGATPLRPSLRSLEATQDRLAEKRFLESCGIPVAPSRNVESLDDLQAAADALGAPTLLKTRRLGYDGKGQLRLTPASDLAAAWDRLGRVPAVLEAVVPFAFECSSILAVATDGSVRAYDITRNRHEDGILRWSRAAAGLDGALDEAAVSHAARAARTLGHVGVFTIEWFVVTTPAGPALVANEIAPRVHNSGHWTQDAALTSQFEQHVRAIAGWPLGNPARLAEVEMENLIGDDVVGWRELAADPAVKLHLYGKSERRPGRKMGHLNRLFPSSGRSAL